MASILSHRGRDKMSSDGETNESMILGLLRMIISSETLGARRSKSPKMLSAPQIEMASLVKVGPPIVQEGTSF